MKSRIMYVECKGGGTTGPGRIARVAFSKSRRSVYFQGRRLQSLNGAGYKSNYFDVETGEHYWVSGPKKSGVDRLYGGMVEVDEDAREEYWTQVRQQPDKVGQSQYRSR